MPHPGGCTEAPRALRACADPLRRLGAPARVRRIMSSFISSNEHILILS